MPAGLRCLIYPTPYSVLGGPTVLRSRGEQRGTAALVVAVVPVFLDVGVQHLRDLREDSHVAFAA
ncbi:hypothetical protein KY092_19790, partial [Natronomonas gomsonensis]|nr:hypothetical protein [Natronomonas gomsonensis]